MVVLPNVPPTDMVGHLALLLLLYCFNFYFSGIAQPLAQQRSDDCDVSCFLLISSLLCCFAVCGVVVLSNVQPTDMVGPWPSCYYFYYIVLIFTFQALPNHGRSKGRMIAMYLAVN